jgi:GxxExxY protein
MIKNDPRTFKIIGSAMEVHKQLGCGFLEAVYQEAFAIELQTQGVTFSREVELPVFYKEHRLNTYYRADFICFDSIIVELKALNKIGGVEEAQILNYLKATGFEIGLLINFGAPSLEYKRYIYTKK